jgi:hypothetical protein
MAHDLLAVQGACGTDVLAAGSYDTTIAGHEGPYQNLIKPICAVAYVSANLTISGAVDASGVPVKNNFVESAVALVSADGQMVFTDAVYAFTCDQPCKIWYAQ